MKRLQLWSYFLVIILGCSNANKESLETQAVVVDGEDTSVPALTDSVAQLPLSSIKLPAGFNIAVYAEVNNARSLALSTSGTLFIGNRDGDKVYAVRDTDG